MMTFRRESRAALALLLATLLVCSPAHALVRLNESRDQIFITGTVAVTRDSNIFANSDGQGDYVYSSSLIAEYTRRAGWIGVNASVQVDGSRYGAFESENFQNPSYSLELTKQTGRTTGSLGLSAQRESRADAAVNLRSTSWNYGADLNFKYPIVGTFTLSGKLGYSSRKYIDDTVFADLATYSAAFDIFHIFTAERDLVGGYRYRYSETSLDTATTDHAFTAGVSGKIIRGINGAVRFGYQVRKPHGAPAGEGQFSSWTASGSASYALSKRLSITGLLSKDFSTTATDTSVDTVTAALNGQYAYSSRWALTSGVSWGDSRFLGERGRLVVALGPPLVLGPNRHDNFLTWDAALSYSMNEHLRVALSYTWFKNWSTLAYADFVRSTWNLNVSSRW